MQLIDQELKRIASILGEAYIRANSINEANIETHYKRADNPLIIYTGFGAVRNFFEGAQPLKEVSVQVYVLQKTPSTDALAENNDQVMTICELIAKDILYNFNAERDIITWQLTPVLEFDDILTGYLLEFSPIMEGYAS